MPRYGNGTHFFNIHTTDGHDYHVVMYPSAMETRLADTYKPWLEFTDHELDSSLRHVRINWAQVIAVHDRGPTI